MINCYFYTRDRQTGLIQLNKNLSRYIFILLVSLLGVKDAAGYMRQPIANKADSAIISQKNQEINQLLLKQQAADNARLKSEVALAKRLFWIRNVIALFVIAFIVIIIRNNRQKNALNKVLQKQNEDIALQKAEILQQKETLHQLNQTKDQLFSIISHDLRAPFAAILQSMEGMKAGDFSPEEQKEVLNGFYQQLSMVTMMVNNLLAWAGNQQTGNKTETEKLNITSVIDEIVSVSGFLAKNKRINLVHHTCQGEKYVSADLNHVKIIFGNLIGNAIKFTPHGGSIEIFYSDDDDYQAIHVKDNGIGILPQKMEKLFKVTGKGISGFGTNNEAGAGIGLGLIKQFVDANNGKLEVKSKPGEGAEFIVYLEKAA